MGSVAKGLGASSQLFWIPNLTGHSPVSQRLLASHTSYPFVLGDVSTLPM